VRIAFRLPLEYIFGALLSLGFIFGAAANSANRSRIEVLDGDIDDIFGRLKLGGLCEWRS